MKFLKKECESFALSLEYLIDGFDCGNEDLNDFFNHDAIKPPSSKPQK
ncbi:MAG: hypothetical protein LBQ73_10195 [Tannerellaceae bacterium]|jgi:hypothetical protein|nr:hypothetical protein [Tannerellaceae bacterium]